MDKSAIEVPGIATLEDGDDSHVPCLTVGDWVYVSGMAGVDDEGEIVSAEFDSQVRQTFENLETTLREARSSLEDIYHATVWLTDMRMLDHFVSLGNELLNAQATVTIIGAGGLVDPEARVEVEVRALRSDANIEKEVLDIPEVGVPDAFDHASGIKVGDLVFLSGQMGVDESYNPVSLEFLPQMERVLKNVTSGLGEAGSDVTDLVHMTTWLTDLRNTEHFTDVRSRTLGENVTTSTRVGITELSRKDSLVEMEAIGVDSAVGKHMVDHPDGLPLSTTERDGEVYPRYWQCVTAADWIFTAGMVGVDTDYNPVSRKFKPQARTALEYIETALDAAGASWDEVIHTRTYLTDMRYAEEYFSIREETMGDAQATSTVTHSPALAQEGLKLEVEAIAINPS